MTAQQCGYRRHLSTTDEQVHLENAVKNHIIEGIRMVTVFFDLEKEFH